MSAPRCQHERTVDLDDTIHGYSGSVSGLHGDENRAAHGGICLTVRCLDCGSHRDENRNGRHVEIGSWGPSTEERRAIAQRRRERARRVVAAVSPIEFESSDGRVLHLELDKDGFIRASGCAHTETDVETAVKSVPEWYQGAMSARRAVLLAEQAEREVQ